MSGLDANVDGGGRMHHILREPWVCLGSRETEKGRRATRKVLGRCEAARELSAVRDTGPLHMTIMTRT